MSTILATLRNTSEIIQRALVNNAKAIKISTNKGLVKSDLPTHIEEAIDRAKEREGAKSNLPTHIKEVIARAKQQEAEDLLLRQSEMEGPHTGKGLFPVFNPSTGAPFTEAEREQALENARFRRFLDSLTEETSEVSAPSAIGEVPSSAFVDENVSLWGSLYQTESDPNKMAKFRDDVSILWGRSEKEEVVHGYIQEAISAVSTYNLGSLTYADTVNDNNQFHELMYMTYLHESSGGIYDTQTNGGPARGWWQVEMATAKDVFVTGRVFWTPEVTQYTGYSITDFEGMSDQELSDVLKDPKVNSAMAVIRYVRAAISRGVVI